MKKSVFKFVFSSAFVLAVVYSIYASQQNAEMSDLALANVEALANCENSTSYTGAREYQAENRCICLHCPEDGDSSCKCLRGG